MFGDDGDQWAHVVVRWCCVYDESVLVWCPKGNEKNDVCKKKKSVPEGLTKTERVLEALREIQWETNCSTKTLQSILTALRGNLGRLVREIDPEDLPATITKADSKMQSMVFVKWLCFFCMHVSLITNIQNTHTGRGKTCWLARMCRLR